MGNQMSESVLNENVLLRKLEPRDAEPMFEWIRDPDIYTKMRYDVSEKSLEQCYSFIEKSWESDRDLHYAVSNEKGEYFGTVSLKNIDEVDKTAEFAIVLCKNKIGKGIGQKALIEMMRIAFEERGYHKVYLYVRSDNIHAVTFYERNCLRYEGCSQEHIGGEERELYWYALFGHDYLEWKKKVVVRSMEMKM